MNPSHLSRRAFLSSAAGAGPAAPLPQRRAAADEVAGKKGNINHSVCKWCYPKVSLDDLCTAGKEFGLQSVELLEVKDFDTLKKHGLQCAMVSGVPGGINKGLNRVENHDK